MKTTHQQRTVSIVNVVVQHVIALSSPEKGFNTTTTPETDETITSGNLSRRRRRSVWDDEEEEEF